MVVEFGELVEARLLHTVVVLLLQVLQHVSSILTGLNRKQALGWVYKLQKEVSENKRGVEGDHIHNSQLCTFTCMTLSHTQDGFDFHFFGKYICIFFLNKNKNQSKKKITPSP